MNLFMTIPYKVIRHDPGFKPAVRHHVLAVTLKNGECFIFDLTGAQYGITGVVHPHDKYIKNYSLPKFHEHHDFGYNLTYKREIAAGKHDKTLSPDFDYGAARILRQLMVAMNVSVKHWEGMNKTTVKKLLADSAHGFQEGTKAVVEAVDTHIRPFNRVLIAFSMSRRTKGDESRAWRQKMVKMFEEIKESRPAWLQQLNAADEIEIAHANRTVSAAAVDQNLAGLGDKSALALI